MKKQEKLWDSVRLFGAVTGVTFLFYRSVIWMLLTGLPLGYLSYCSLRREWEERRRWQMNLEFKEGLQSIAAALSAGYSIENALEEGCRDLELLYGGDSVMAQEFRVMLKQLQYNQPVETVFDEFARRSQVRDIEQFAEVFRTAKRSGGDLVAITRLCAERIGEKQEVNREIHTMISGKRMEERIMNIVPLGMIAYFWVCSPGFLDCFYQSIGGHLLMTVYLIIYLVAYFLGERIVSACRPAV